MIVQVGWSSSSLVLRQVKQCCLIYRHFDLLGHFCWRRNYLSIAVRNSSSTARTSPWFLTDADSDDREIDEHAGDWSGETAGH